MKGANLLKTVRVETCAGKCCFIFPVGYLDAELGGAILSHIQDGIANKIPIIVLSLAESPLINSLGMARLIEGLEITGDSHSELWFADLTPLHEKTLAAAGVLPIIPRVTTVSAVRQEIGLPVS